MTFGRAGLALILVMASAASARLPDDRDPPPPPIPNAPTPTPTPEPAPAPSSSPTATPAPDHAAPPAQRGTDPAPCVAFPHPMISEVLFAVPTGTAGDASGDGVRDVSGDEFIELYNPHGRVINLKGYVLSDSTGIAPRGSTAGGGGTGIRFAFPAMDVPPGGVVVVFNGRNTTFTGPVGDAMKGPSGPNPAFGGAFVLSMKVASQRSALSNAADAVNLVAPDGTLVHRVSWGKPKDGPKEAPKDAQPHGAVPKLDETCPAATKCSVYRDGVGVAATWRLHTDLQGEAFSPGRVPYAAPGVAPAPSKAPGSTPARPARTPKPPTKQP